MRTYTESGLDMGYNEIPEDGVWDGTDDLGEKLANGVYLYKITATTAGGQKGQATGKLVIMK